MNANCLQGIRCPNENCKSFGPFRIEVTTSIVMTDDGSELPDGDMDWTQDSAITCQTCGKDGIVDEFTIDKATPDPVTAPEPFQIPLNEVTLGILGKVCFRCGKLAQALREVGHEIPTKAEYEQAHVIHWLLNLYLKHGDDYYEHSIKYLKIAL